jgi:ATP-dependent RNA helicase DHX8/PRP22
MAAPASNEPEVYGIYTGKITKIQEFGAFVSLDGFSNREGLVHISQLRAARVMKVEDAVKQKQFVRVKVLSIIGSKLSLSMREVDQDTGADLRPRRREEKVSEAGDLYANPERGMGAPGGSGQSFSGDRAVMEAAKKVTRVVKRLSSPERWEAAQMEKAGVLGRDRRNDPRFDEVRAGSCRQQWLFLHHFRFLFLLPFFPTPLPL